MDITRLFNKFAGKEVKDPKRVTTDIDLVLLGMAEVAKKNGLKLRVFFPGMVGTMDYKANRVNANIKKGTDGKYRVSHFTAG
ncbi:MAG: hypothetical protein HY052_05170 [Proteobacteria bacterium]|nr:hypothetical protein [Pseudomonadota bacterium]